jgi:diguanylate cyclase (GGDEF)-like protein
LPDADFVVLHLAILRLYLRLEVTTGLAAAIEKASAALDDAAHLHEPLLLLLAQASQRLGRYSVAAAFYQAAMALQFKQAKKRPRRLLDVEFKLQKTTSEIEIDLLRHKNALQHEQVRQLESTTYRDALTGLHNLRYLQARWDELMVQAHQSHVLSVMHLGVDQSTHLREVMGDAVADECAQRIANVLRRYCPNNAELVAANNNEFRLVWPQAASPAVVQLVSEIQQAVSELDCAHLPEALTVSIGCTAYHPGDSVDVLQLRADLALYLAMRRGAGAVVWEGAV